MKRKGQIIARQGILQIIPLKIRRAFVLEITSRDDSIFCGIEIVLHRVINLSAEIFRFVIVIYRKLCSLH